MTKQTVRYTIALAAISLFAIVALNPTAFALQEQPESVDEFEGKFVTVYYDAERVRGTVLKDVSLKEMGGRIMLVGTGVDTGDPDNWTAGVRIGMPWDTVEFFYALTPEQFEDGAKKYSTF